MQEAQDLYRNKVLNQERDSGKESRLSANSGGPVHTAGCIGEGRKEYSRLKLSISDESGLFLIDTGADLSLVKAKKKKKKSQ
jgi:hypothetical protein